MSKNYIGLLYYNINYGGIQHNLVHVLSHGPTHKICLVCFGIIFKFRISKSFLWALYSNNNLPYFKVWNNVA
jgi:hypothetical protein